MSNRNLTIHLVSHAHLDPVWQWRKGEGIDEALATCRSARDRLREFPEFTYLQGEAWVYEQIERHDPELFASIVELVQEGRWEIVGGWYLQPDCNFLTAESFRKQMEMGRDFFMSRFGRTPRVGFNPDSFGHAASLPDILAEFGFRNYVHMRPEQPRMPLAAPLYRWRGVGGAEMLNYRVVDSYNAFCEAWFDRQMEKILLETPDYQNDALAFLGVGDHGGGATAHLIEYALKKRNAWENTTIEFSSFERFFDAVEPLRERLPVKEGELQYFAIGCYSVNREIKTAMREAEYALIREKDAVENFGSVLSSEQRAEIDRQVESDWKTVLFNQFHDILPGSLIRTGRNDAVRELGGVITRAEDALTLVTRRLGLARPEHPEQRIFIANPSSAPFDGIVGHTPWVHYEGFREMEILDEKGNPVPFQRTDAEAYVTWYTKLLFPVTCEPGQLRTLTLRPSNRVSFPSEPSENLQATPDGLESRDWKIEVSSTGIAQISRKNADGSLQPLLGGRGAVVEAAEDYRDSWAMIGPCDFCDEPIGVFVANGPWTVEEVGPIRATLCRVLRFEESTLTWRIRLFSNSPRIEFDMKILSANQRRRFTLRIPTAEPIGNHIDGIPGAMLERTPSTQEYPFQDWTSLPTGETTLGILSPDVFSFSVRPSDVHFTLLRTTPFAWTPGAERARADRMGDMNFTDQGEFEFHFALLPDAAIEDLRVGGANLQQPLLIWDLTKGMKYGTDYVFGPPAMGTEIGYPC